MLLFTVVASKVTLPIVLWRGCPCLWKNFYSKGNPLKESQGLYWLQLLLCPSRKFHEGGGVIGCGATYIYLVSYFLVACIVVLGESLGVQLCVYGMRIVTRPP